MLIKKSALALLMCFTFIVSGFTQIIDSSYRQVKTNGVWDTIALEISTRDEACALLSNLLMKWDEVSQSWVKSSRSTYTEDPSKNTSQSIEKSWDAVNKKWINSSRGILTSYNGGLKEIFVFKTWNSVANSWVNNIRLTAYFDRKGRAIESIFEVYSNNMWGKENRTLLSYDSNDRIIESISQGWTNNTWTNNSKSTYDYVNNGMGFDSLWDVSKNKWIRFRKSFNTYLGNTSLPVQSRLQIITDSGWQNVSLSKNTYNYRNQQLSSLYQFWDENTQAWVNSFRTKNDYYADGDLHYFQFEQWDKNTRSWNSGSKSTNSDISCSPGLQFAAVSEAKSNIGISMQSSNGNYLLRNQLRPKNNAASGISKKINVLPGNSNTIVYDLNFNDNSGQAFQLIFSAHIKSEVRSSDIIANTVITNNNSFVLSPNPAKNYFNINLSSYKNTGDIILKLSDVAGKLILQQKMNAGMQKVILPSLQKGMYIVTISSGKSIQSQKLLIE